MPALNPAKLFVGGRHSDGQGRVYLMGSGADDHGELIGARAETLPYAPAGVGGEAIFTALMPVVIYTAGCSLRFIPIVDGVVYDGTDAEDAGVTVTLTTPPNGRRTRWLGNVGLGWPYARDGVVRGRFALRGTWCQVRVDLVSSIALDATGNPGTLILDGHEVEFEEVENTVPRTASPVYAAVLDGAWLLDGAIGLGG